MPFASGQPLVCQGGDRDWLVQEPIVYRGQTEMVEVQLTSCFAVTRLLRRRPGRSRVIGRGLVDLG